KVIWIVHTEHIAKFSVCQKHKLIAREEIMICKVQMRWYKKDSPNEQRSRHHITSQVSPTPCHGNHKRYTCYYCMDRFPQTKQNHPTDNQGNVKQNSLM